MYPPSPVSFSPLLLHGKRHAKKKNVTILTIRIAHFVHLRTEYEKRGISRGHKAKGTLKITLPNKRGKCFAKKENPYLHLFSLLCCCLFSFTCLFIFLTAIVKVASAGRLYSNTNGKRQIIHFSFYFWLFLSLVSTFFCFLFFFLLSANSNQPPPNKASHLRLCSNTNGKARNFEVLLERQKVFRTLIHMDDSVITGTVGIVGVAAGNFLGQN
jgi:hypothetical protein